MEDRENNHFKSLARLILMILITILCMFLSSVKTFAAEKLIDDDETTIVTSDMTISSDYSFFVQFIPNKTTVETFGSGWVNSFHTPQNEKDQRAVSISEKNIVKGKVGVIYHHVSVFGQDVDVKFTIKDYGDLKNQDGSIAFNQKEYLNNENNSTEASEEASIEINQSNDSTDLIKEDVFSNSLTKDFEPSTYSDAVGYIYIPKINVLELLYLGASQEHLYQGVAQMNATSLPLSGMNHQTVIAGHRGGYTSAQFLYIDQLTYGDHIYIDYLGEKAVYTVFRTDIIKNYGENSTLKDIEGLDMLTLYTCHPYPQNYERLLVRSLKDEKAPIETPQIASGGNIVYADSDSSLKSEDVKKANDILGTNGKQNNHKNTSWSEKLSDTFTSVTNKYQIELLIIWTLLGIIATVKVSILLLKEYRRKETKGGKER